MDSASGVGLAGVCAQEARSDKHKRCGSAVRTLGPYQRASCKVQGWDNVRPSRLQGARAMKSSLIERYEQILNQDPASTVFVELAKALILKEEYAQAIEICQKGLEHHPESVIGRVLWGKALIYLRRPAEAMEQFDRATSIDRENPYAYNLIAEVLLQKGLYRSALPLLRKAVALQPNDARVKDWLKKAQ